MKRKYFFVGLVLILVVFLVGCGGVISIPNQSPTASFTADPTSGVVPLGVSFNASSSSDSDGSITSYAWDFKDGNTGTGQNNTTKIVTWLNSHPETDRAAQLCDALVYGGYSDWFWE